MRNQDLKINQYMGKEGREWIIELTIENYLVYNQYKE